MKDFEIRRIVPSDMDKWFELRIQSLKDSPTAFLASPDKEISQGVDFFTSRIREGGDKNVIFGCFNQTSHIVGTIGLVQEHHKKAEHKAFIWGMYVAPDFRNQKIGEALMQEAMKFARQTMKVAHINLSVEASNEPAKKLYSRLGFKVWGHEKDAMFVDGKFYSEDYMKLILS